jgi:hypothetical protein
MVNPVGSSTTVNSSLSSHSLQAAIELVYANIANTVLTVHMSSLANALGVTENISNTLASLQNLHNDVSIKSTGTFPFDYATGAVPSATGMGPPAASESAYEAAYEKAASAFFSGPVQLSASFPSGFASFKSQIMAVEAQLSAQVIQLSAITPASSTGSVDPNSLLATTKQVLKDLKTANVSTQAGSLAWLIDNYNTPNATGANSAGQFQQDITNAITAAQNLNTTQTESVRSFLYLFEEYYKSASAILTQLTQLIQKMADGIAH